MIRSGCSPSILHSSDGLQALTFALCHVYARATRSVSIPAPVYCEGILHFRRRRCHLTLLSDAHIVCSRAKIHYDPQGPLGLSDSATIPSDAASATLEAFRAGFKQVHNNQARLMYFS